MFSVKPDSKLSSLPLAFDNFAYSNQLIPFQ
jgi:hypothetical protein